MDGHFACAPSRRVMTPHDPHPNPFNLLYLTLLLYHPHQTFQHLVKVDDTTNIKRVCCKAIWPTTARDFVVCTSWQKLDDGSIVICTRSASDELFEKQKNFVRATINISGYWIQPVTGLPNDDPMYESSSESDACKVTLISHMDLGGSLPAYVLNMVQVEGPIKTLSGIRKALQKKAVKPAVGHPEKTGKSAGKSEVPAEKAEKSVDKTAGKKADKAAEKTEKVPAAAVAATAEKS